MGTFGDKLRREREMRAITLEEIAEATKIGTRSLKALEDEKFNILPGGIFNKGFVRAYARYLGLDQEQAVVDYMVAAGEQHPGKTDSGEINRIVSQAEMARQRQDALDAASGKQSSGSWKSFIVLLLLIAVCAGGWKYYELRKAAKVAAVAAQAQAAREAAIAVQIQAEKAKSEQEAAALAQASATTDPNSPAGIVPSADVATTGQAVSGKTLSTTPAQPAAVPQEFHVQVRAKEKMWVSVTADGKVVKKGFLAADEAQTFNARTKLVLISGKPGGLEVQWNGKALPIPRVNTSSQTLTFTLDGMQ